MTGRAPGPGSRVVLVDGTVLADRAFFAVPAKLVTRGGLHTNALYGLAQACRRVLAGMRPSHAVALFDPPGALRGVPGRDPVVQPVELRQQRPWFEPVFRAHGFAVHHPEARVAEALAGLAARAVERGAEVRIVSPDKWLLQLVSDEVRIDDPLKELTWDPDAVVRRFGVRPALLPDFWALVGDDALNAPGVRGIGPKKATALLAERGRADEAGEEAAAVADALRLDDAEAPPDWLRWAFEPPDPAALNDLYRELELVQLLAAQAPAAPPEYFVCDLVDIARAALAEVQSTPTAVGLRLLVDGDRITGVGVAIRPGRAVYFPLAGSGEHLGAEGLALLAPWLASDRPKVLHDAKAAIRALAIHGLELGGAVGDTRLASHRIDPSERLPHDLDQVARFYLHRAVQAERATVGRGAERQAFAELPIGRAGAYACHLADTVVALWPVLERRLRGLGQGSASLTEDLPLARALARVECRGMRVDPDALARLASGFADLRSEVQAAIDQAAGRTVRVGSVRDVGRLLFEELDLPVLRRTKTGYKTDADVLERLADRHPVVPLILRWRTLAQLERTWARGLAAHVGPDGRIHSTVQIATSHNGQLVNRAPDLQRVPGRTAEGALVRACFAAEPGWQILSADWSQLELRLLAHLTGDPVLVDAFREGADVHQRTADLLGVPREVGKVVNFATLYGQGASSLGIVLGRPRKEASAIIARFDRTFAATRAWQARVLALGIERGVATTLTGRRRVLHELTARDGATRAYGERQAKNFPVQGTAADLCRRAIVRVDQALRDAGLRGGIVLSIVDELILEAPSDEVEATVAIVRREMEGALELAVPLVVRIGVGPTWAGAGK